jgi:hypothetical protein
MPATPPALPLVHALLMCDGFHLDAARQCYILGTMTGAKGTVFPLILRDKFVYMMLTEIYGRVELTFRWIHAIEDIVCLEGQLVVETDSPLRIVEIGSPVPEIVFPKPGPYRLQLIVGNEMVADRTLEISSGT